jgi:hypothetical protein
MLTVHIADCRAGQAPLTWGQRSILRIVIMLGEAAQGTNLGTWSRLPAGTRVPEAVDRISQLVSRYESTRTRFVRSDDDWYQLLDGSGDLTIEVESATDADLAEKATAAQTELRGQLFDYAVEWPIRFRLLVDGDRALAVVWTASHLVTDLRGVWAFNTALNAPDVLPDTGIQPLDQAAAEQSPAGQTADEQAMAYWRDQVIALDPETDPPHEPHDGYRFWYAGFESPAMTAALGTLSARHRTTTSVILFAAFTAVLAETLGQDAVTVTLLAANRTRRETRAAVGSFSQLVPVTMTTADVAWPELVRQATMRTLGALRRSAYDPRSLEALRRSVERDRGGFPDLTMSFNDVSGTFEAPEGEPEALPRGTVRWNDNNNSGDSTLYAWVWGGRETRETWGGPVGRLAFTLMIDTRRISTEQAERLLTGIEERLVHEAASLTVQA